MNKCILKRIFCLFEDKDSKLSVFIDFFLLVLILLNVTFIVLDSFKTIHDKYYEFFTIFEVVSVIIFSIEYVLRLITSPYLYSDKYEFKKLLKYSISLTALIDLFAVLPFFLPLILPYDLRVLRTLRLFRLVKIFKINRYFKTIDFLINIFKKKYSELFATVILLFVALFLISTFIYYFENELQPEVFSDIGKTFKWSFKTMVFLSFESNPITTLGKIFGMLTIVLGLSWLTLPVSIISSSFIEEFSKNKNK